MNEYPGILVVFDGIDGAGKTTQAQKLATNLAAVGETVVLSKEPTDGIYGAKLRASALSGRLPFDEELELFIADRKEHLSEKVAPALQAGHVVILDRYFYSTLAYQGLRAGSLHEIEPRIRKDTIEPDITFLIDTAANQAISRIQIRDGEENHFEKLDDLLKIGELFNKIAKTEKSMHKIDGSRKIEEVYSEISKIFIEGPFKAKRCAKSYGCDEPLYCTPRLTNTCDWWRMSKLLRQSTL